MRSSIARLTYSSWPGFAIVDAEIPAIEVKADFFILLSIGQLPQFIILHRHLVHLIANYAQYNVNTL